MHFRPFRRHRPSWWPDNEPWPPIDRSQMWRRMPRRFVLRIGGLIFLALLLLCGLGTFILWLIGGFVNAVNAPLNAPLGTLVVIVILIILLNVGGALRRSIAPIGDLLEASGRVADGDYSVRVRERGPREVRQLARSFNTMTTRLPSNEELRRSLLADVTHELRTPLTVIQGNLEGMLDGVYSADETNLRSLLDETNLLSRLVEDLRTLALAESGALKLKKAPTDLVMLARDVIATFQSQAETARVTLTVEAAA